jgi:hypothetical protein
MVLPYCSDETLLKELASLVTAGGRLPTLAENASKVPHLLLLGTPDAAEPYRARANRLLQSIDAAILGGRLGDDADADLTVDQQYGLRILFGLQSDYRDTTAKVRRENAADFLVPGWLHKPGIRDRAGTFQRRHQSRVCALLLSCLKATYGQEERPSELEVDHLWEIRDYWVDERRQVYRFRNEATIQSRVDNLELVYVYQHGSVLEGYERQTIEGLTTADGLTTVSSVEETEQVDGPDFITLRLPQRLQTGECCSYSWQQKITYGSEVARWKTGFVIFGARNDDFGFEVSVHFSNRPPESVWWIEDLPMAEHADGPRLGQIVMINEQGIASYRRPPPTNRAMGYGLAWRWQT